MFVLLTLAFEIYLNCQGHFFEKKKKGKHLKNKQEAGLSIIVRAGWHQCFSGEKSFFFFTKSLKYVFLNKFYVLI